MSHTPVKKAPLKQKTIRHTDPNVLQNRASNPQSSIWVGASAGSGKTKVLTDRMLRLLLPNKQGQNGAPPHKILALTFTKAGANEMSLRINKRLSEWAVMPLDSKDGLTENLNQLIGYAPTDTQIESARKLFAAVVDTPGGLKIMTIHSFCQSVLGRFPLEANLTPGFKALEEHQAAILLKQAQKQVFKQADDEKGSPLTEAIHNLVLSQNEDQFSALLQSLISERRQLEQILEKNFGVDGLYTALCKALNVPAGKTQDAFIFDACADTDFNSQGLWSACKALSEGTKTDIKRADALQQWLELDQKSRAQNFNNFYKIFITDKDTIRAKLATNGVLKNNPDIEDILKTEARRALDLGQKIQAIKIATLTRDLFMLGDAILKQYQNIKEQIGALDFDDLILRTLDLLQGQTANMKGLNVAPWIRYKLDQGIDHILVDEAQDTNPEQWKIVQAISDDFFDNASDQDITRTLFVVGDQKQSIFSFQRASPEKFTEMRQWFEKKIINTGKSFAAIDFNVSFRSVQSVLELVDSIFAPPEMREGLDINDIKHEAYRRTQAGLVELWPLFENPEKQDTDPWTPPIEVIDSSSGATQMAAHIGDTIKKWIDEKEILKSYDRPIEAGDIMILVRSRTAFLDQLVRTLKIRNIPVSGVDRMILSQQLVVQDLCAAASFALLPDDELTLACLLKSPFIGWNEDQLFNVCHNRDKKSLWSIVKETTDDKTVQWLQNLIYRAGKDRPYEFFATILQTPCPINDSGLKAIKARLGDESLDPLDEFLNGALSFEKDNIPTLQNFIQAQIHNETQIKREMEEAGNAVRIMTVHGAKGLQAPIVILPDTTRTAGSVKPSRILWPDRSGSTLPYFCPQSKNLPSVCDDAMDILKTRSDEEYRRLLYVALTRAEERLYVGGYKGSKKISDDCWYNHIKNGFENLPNVKTIEENNLEILRSTNPATDKPDRATKDKKSTSIKISDTPNWLFEKIKDEPFPPKPLTPSRPSESEAPALSPLKADDNYRFLRGNITHKLLQILPDLKPQDRKDAALKYVSLPAHGISTKVQNEIVSETMDILENPEFTAIFGENSMAEVPVTGLLSNNRLLSGQIDRLLVTDDEILIIDYKTNRPPPKKIKDVPLIYKNQLKAYADVMRNIYKGRKIRTALIWTDGARLMELKDL